MNPYEIHGPQYLLLYLAAMVVVGIVAGIVKSILVAGSAGGASSGSKNLRLHPYEIAYLSGGETLALQTAVGYMLHKQIFASDDSTSTGAKRIKAESNPHELLVNIHENESPPDNVDEAGIQIGQDLEFRVAAEAHGRTWAEVLGRKSRYKDVFERIRVRLMKKGLIADRGCESLCRVVAVAAALVPPLVLGIPRIVETFSTHRPVFLLVLLVMISFLLAIVSCYQGAMRTGEGNKFLSKLKDQNRGLYTTVSSGSTNVGAYDMALALAVFGTTLIMAPGFFMFKEYFIPPVSTSSSGSCSSCSSCGGGCGGGCGGCGGCGG